MVAIDIPAGYGLVVIFNFVLPAFVLAWAGGRAAASRKATGVGLPNMFAFAGMTSKDGGKVTEDQALAFNCAQRGHYNPLETISCFRFCSLVAGFLNPYVTALAGAIWCVGRVSWALGYDGKGGRYAKGFKVGGLHWVAFIIVVGMAGYEGVVYSGLF